MGERRCAYFMLREKGLGNVRESCELLINAEIKSHPSKGRKFLATLLLLRRNFLISLAQSLIAFPADSS